MKVLLLLIALVVGFLLYVNIKTNSQNLKSNTQSEEATIVPTVLPQLSKKEYLFVPYWSFFNSIATNSEYSLIYFGVGANMQGVDESDPGYEKLDQFIQLTPNASERILTIRMLDKNINAQVLKSESVQKRIASEAVGLAQEYGFDGVLLDYETSAFAFDSTIQNISSFYELFSAEVKKNKLLFYVTLYGDTYHQSRAYDVVRIGELSDKVLVMAYDFSKSRGNPGPNFPLSGREKYGYDFEKMIEDYQKDVSNEKLVITLGYFGYDWMVDDNGEAKEYGLPLSLNEIEQDFIDSCNYKQCTVGRDEQTMEPVIKYIDENGENHIVRYEDEVSVLKKKEVLNKNGILEIASWAYSYY